jgi:Spy/CpxP family protein refolding chaperone
MRVLAGVLFLAGLLMVTSLSTAQPPGGGKGGQPGKGGKGGFGKGGFGGGFAMPQPGQIMPTFIAERLKLTDDQKKQVETLQKDVDEKLAKILTEDQQKQLKEMKDRAGRGGFGRPGGAGGKGGDKGGNPPPPPVEE